MDTESHPFVVSGNSLSGMIAALRLANQGKKVVVANGTKHWGGHFVTVNLDGIAFDAGMVLHEFTAFNASDEPEDISTYDANIRNDTGRFCQTIRAFVQSYQSTHEVQDILMYVAGQYLPDMIIANQLSAIQSLPHAVKIHKELAQIATQGRAMPLHASKKHHDQLFMQTDYAVISLANHGESLHGLLIEPFCKKLLNISTQSVLAYYHRVPWLPLFYPETLLSYFSPTPQSIAPTVFSYPDQGCIGDVAQQIKEALLAHENVSLVEAFPNAIASNDDGLYDITFASHEKIQAARLAWSGNLPELIHAIQSPQQFPEYQKASFSLVFVTIQEQFLRKQFSVLSVVDASLVCYRITNQSRCGNRQEGKQRLVIELNLDYCIAKTGKQTTEEISALVLDELVTLGIVGDTAHVEVKKTLIMKNALALPNRHNLEIFESEYALVKQQAPDIELLSGSSGFSSSSFNHQVLQGLKLTHDWSTH